MTSSWLRFLLIMTRLDFFPLRARGEPAPANLVSERTCLLALWHYVHYRRRWPMVQRRADRGLNSRRFIAGFPFKAAELSDPRAHVCRFYWFGPVENIFFALRRVCLSVCQLAVCQKRQAGWTPDSFSVSASLSLSVSPLHKRTRARTLCAEWNRIESLSL